MNKYTQEKIDLNEDAFLYKRGDRSSPFYYLRIAKQPHWKDVKIISLKTKDKDKAIKKAKKEYDEIMSTDNLVKRRLFNKEDIEIATRNAGLGRIAEDKFKNLMLIKGYQVYTPVEDIWGIDFVLIKDGVTYTVQLKSSNKVKSLSIIILSAKSGIPCKPKRVATIPSFTLPFFDNSKSSACCIIKTPKSEA